MHAAGIERFANRRQAFLRYRLHPACMSMQSDGYSEVSNEIYAYRIRSDTRRRAAVR